VHIEVIGRDAAYSETRGAASLAALGCDSLG
jgi:hypothetical protein